MDDLRRDPADLLAAVVGPRHVVSDPEVVVRHVVDWTGAVGAHRATVVRPGSTAEVAEVLRRCGAAGIPVVPQGGNTGLVWGSVPPADGWVVLSTERLGGIGEVDSDAGQVSVGAGVTLGELARRLAGTGWRYGVDFGAREQATVGGTIATNAGGTGVFRHGDTRRQVLGVEAVLADGTVIGRLRAVEKDNTGYSFGALLAGSEGTLAVITAARLRLVADPPARCTVLVGMGSVEEAVALAGQLRRRLPELEACELLGPGAAETVAGHTARPNPVVGDPAALLVESAGDDAALLAERLGEIVEGAAGVRSASVALDAGRRAELWAVREGVTEALAATGRVLKLDVSLPTRALVPTLRELEARVAAADPTARLVAFGHVGDQNLHINVVGLDPSAESSLEGDVLAVVAAAGGSISAEHGVGRRRLAHLHLMHTAEESAAMAALKAAWDPGATLNPGVLVTTGPQAH